MKLSNMESFEIILEINTINCLQKKYWYLPQIRRLFAFRIRQFRQQRLRRFPHSEFPIGCYLKVRVEKTFIFKIVVCRCTAPFEGRRAGIQTSREWPNRWPCSSSPIFSAGRSSPSSRWRSRPVSNSCRRSQNIYRLHLAAQFLLQSFPLRHSDEVVQKGLRPHLQGHRRVEGDAYSISEWNLLVVLM